MALAGVTDQIVYLEEGDVVDLQLGKYWISARQADGRYVPVQRAVRTVLAHSGAAELGPYRHYMQKEIFEQPRAIADTLEGVLGITPELFGDGAYRVFKEVDQVLILACGTSYYTGCTAKYWLEASPASRPRSRSPANTATATSVPNPRTLVVTITQSGETADTLAALKHARSAGHDAHADHLQRRHQRDGARVQAGLHHARRRRDRRGLDQGLHHAVGGPVPADAGAGAGARPAERRAGSAHLKAMRHLPVALQAVLALEPQIIAWAEDFARKENALFLGRGLHYPIALEGALKLKEISYIHAEAYPAGELKHGPLALVTGEMPVVTVAPNDALLEKLKSNMQEVRARGGELYVFADADTRIESEPGVHVIRMPEHYGALSPILHVVPLQLLAYHTACARGTDVDKPRNLAKSVTVE